MAAISGAAFAAKAIERMLKAGEDQPDKALLALGDDFRAAWAHERHVAATTPEDDDASLFAAHEAAIAIAKRIVALRAATPAGAQVKAMVAAWADGRRFDQLCGGESPWIGNIAIQSLLDDLGVVPPDPMPATYPADAGEGRDAA